MTGRYKAGFRGILPVRAVAFLTLCGLLMFLPGFFNIPPIDRDRLTPRPPPQT